MTFENEWNQLKFQGSHGAFTFNGTATEWRKAVNGHFRSTTLTRPCYGVYVVRQKATGSVIYIGKSGTMCQDGTFKEQDLEKRLVNREKGERRQVIFGQRVVAHGELVIEYVVLKSKAMLPGYLEALLLQAYYDEHQKLPIDNAAL